MTLYTALHGCYKQSCRRCSTKFLHRRQTASALNHTRTRAQSRCASATSNVPDISKRFTRVHNYSQPINWTKCTEIELFRGMLSQPQLYLQTATSVCDCRLRPQTVISDCDLTVTSGCDLRLWPQTATSDCDLDLILWPHTTTSDCDLTVISNCDLILTDAEQSKLNLTTIRIEHFKTNLNVMMYHKNKCSTLSLISTRTSLGILNTLGLRLDYHWHS